MENTAKAPAHTKHPWLAVDLRHTNGGIECQIANRETHTCVAVTPRYHPESDAGKEARANAAFIVRACNSHYELLEACEAMTAAIEKEAESMTASPIVCELYARMKDAVVRARGENAPHSEE